MIEWLTVFFLLLLGLIFLLAEMFFIPGITIAGILSVIFSGAGVYLSYSYFGSDVGNIIFLITAAINAVSVFYGFKSNLWQKFALNKSINSKVNEDIPVYILNVGDIGITKTILRPIGDAEISGENFEVRSISGMIDVNKQIKIVRIEGKKIFVEEIKSLTN
ncbi:MAG: NfeD family protein [Thermoflexibacter sp.]|jgi:membrane-bound ClpP family serine protease|nr:NfeD family protein [Thermoflexibacter sp.]